MPAEVPASLAASLRLARLRESPEVYRAREVTSGVWRAVNAQQSFVTTWTSAGVAVALAQQEPARLHLASVGCPGHQEPATDASPERDGSELRFRRGDVTEWYLHGEDGLEQGFTVTREPCPGAGQLRLEVAVEGSLRPRLTSDGEVELTAASGSSGLRYGKLWAVDAKGRELPAQMRVDEGRIAIEVETRDAAWPVVVDPLVWTQQAKLQRDDDKLTAFGGSLALDGDTAIVGDTGDNPSTGSNKAAYVFVRTSTGWNSQAKLVVDTTPPADSFGGSVALDGDTALVGASFDSSQKFQAGAVHVFTRQGDVWTQQAKLMPDVASGGQFGNSVALSGDTAVVGAWLDQSGSAFVFTRTGSTWSQQAKLLPLNPGDGSSYFFGDSVSVDGDTALVGAPRDAGHLSGAAYVFVRVNGTWSMQTRLVASKPGYGDQLGSSVSVHGDTALLGAPGDSQLGDRFGSAYIFTRTGETWNQQAKLVASDPTSGSQFGLSVAVGDSTALVANGPLFTGTGSVYVFTPAGQGWAQDKLLFTDGGHLSGLHVRVSLSDGRALVGPVYGPDSQPPSAHVFETRRTPGTPCIDLGPPCEVACVDGVCCDAPCDGQCEACNAQGHCEPTAAGEQPVGDRPRCDLGPDPACHGACDGSHTESCVFPGASTPCGAPACVNDVQTSRSCDGGGACVIQTTHECAPFHCNDATPACLDACSGDADCLPGLVCMENECIPLTPGAGGAAGSEGGQAGNASGQGGAAGSAGSGASGGTSPAGSSGAGTSGGTAGQGGAGPAGAGQAGRDAGPQLEGVVTAGGGCDCHTTSHRADRGGALGLLAVGLMVARRRRAG